MLQQIALWKIETLVDVKRQKQPPGKGGGGGGGGWGFYLMNKIC